MNNLRKLKKKKKGKLLNPQELAQQRLFQISRFSDQQQLAQPDTFLENLVSKHASKNLNLQKTHIVTQPSLGIKSKQGRKPRMSFTFSLNELKQKRNQIFSKSPLPLTSYFLIDQRDKKCIHQSRDKMLRYDYANIIKRRVSKSKKMHSNHVCDIKKQEEDQRLKQIKSQVRSTMHIKNIKLFSKYPSFFTH